MEMNSIKIDILEISVMRWTNSGDFWSEGYKIIHTGASEKKPRVDPRT